MNMFVAGTMLGGGNPVRHAFVPLSSYKGSSTLNEQPALLQSDFLLTNDVGSNPISG